jgi:4-hydroxy-3-methylbut-2-enyl diphosphate reductase
VILDEADARYVCDFIRHGGDPAAFLERFAGSVSPGFDPSVDLERIGMANQTTMLASESLRFQGMVRQAMIDRYGEENVDDHLVAFDTICPATQQRQDALLALLEEPLDLALVIGGYNSSNTGHLAKIASRVVPAYHIQSVREIRSATEIRHRGTDGEMRVSEGWLPGGEVRIGLTAGASTPNLEIGRVVRRLIEFRGGEVPEPTSSEDRASVLPTS